MVAVMSRYYHTQAIQAEHVLDDMIHQDPENGVDLRYDKDRIAYAQVRATLALAAAVREVARVIEARP